ncbi:MAG: hypothetical protein M1820_004286 [Bogoriella megaspora]|nr:MAG: hypothetical protein M1820_004286 [Bogoriella megaspora]
MNFSRRLIRNTLSTPLLLLSFISFALAECPPASSIAYSPFQGPNQRIYRESTGNTDNGCWWWAGCTLAQADEPRKQQFASVALIMGLIPLTLKDIAWPERRIVNVSKRVKPLWVDVLVRALGIVPSVSQKEEKGAFGSSRAYNRVMRKSRWQIYTLAGVAALGLAIGLAATAVLEIFSKRSALGCPYPLTVFTWHLAAIVPAVVMTILGKDKTEPDNANPDIGSTLFTEQDADSEASKSMKPLAASESMEPMTRSIEERGLNPKSVRIEMIPFRRHARPSTTSGLNSSPNLEISPVQGGGMDWIIQLTWAIYYIAGTLVYTSIMAVTVVELVTWVVVSIAVMAASKILGFLLCMASEKQE